MKAFLGIMLTLLFTNGAIITIIPLAVGATGPLLVDDDFESYSVGSFPSDGGWELWFTGAGSGQQKIVDNVSFSPSKSLHLLGASSWAAVAAMPYNSSATLLSYEVYVRIKELGTQYDIARVGFIDLYDSSTPRWYSQVKFLHNGTIRLFGYGELQAFVPNEWYKVKQVTNRVSDTSSVWINDVLKASNVPVDDTGPPRPDIHFNDTLAFSVTSFWAEVEVYFDDVKLYESDRVGGLHIPLDKWSLLAPYIGLIMLVAVFVVAIVHVKKFRPRASTVS